MAQITKEIRVDVSQPNVFQAIVAKQNDCNSRFLKITLVDFGVKIEVPNTAKVTINANRPDGKSDSFVGVANNDGTITVPLAQWMLEVAGLLKCDVSVINTTDNKKLTSTDFFVNVQEAANKNNSISENPDGEIRVITPVNLIDENSTDDQYPSAKAVYDLDNITETASGEVITVESAEAPLQNLRLFGKTEQDGTLGENILPYPYTTQTINGITFTDLGDGRIQVSGTAIADITFNFLEDATIDELVVGRTYRVTGCNYSATNINFGVSFSQTSGATQEFYLLNNQEFTAIATTITGLTATLSVLVGQTINTTIHPKLEVASVNLVSVGDSGSIEVGVYGKNLLEVTTRGGTIHGVTYTINSDKSISISGTPTDTTNWKNIVVNNSLYLPNGKYFLTCSGYKNLNNCFPIMYYKDANGNSQNLARLTGNKDTVTFEVTTGKNNTHLIIGCNPTYTPQGEKLYLSIFPESVTDLSYEQYNKQSLTMPYTLRSVGDIKDEVDFNRGVLIQRCESAKGFTLAENFTNTKRLRASFTNRCVNAKGKSACTHTNNYAYVFNNADYVHYYIENSNVTIWLPIDFDEAKTDEIEVVGVLETPIEIPLTETELNAYRHLMTNKGTTTILSECEDTEITYYINKPNAQAIGNIHSQVNNDYFKLQQAIISLGGN